MGAAALGAVAGFGTGFWYAGDWAQGIAFSAADAVLGAALGGTLLAFHQLVARNDLRTGRSLGQGERSLGQREENLVVASWGLAALLMGSRVYQGIGGFFAARRTNGTLDGFAIVPLDGGGSASVGLRF